MILHTNDCTFSLRRLGAFGVIHGHHQLRGPESPSRLGGYSFSNRRREVGLVSISHKKATAHIEFLINQPFLPFFIRYEMHPRFVVTLVPKALNCLGFRPFKSKVSIIHRRPSQGQ